MDHVDTRIPIRFEPQSDISVICPLALVPVLALVDIESESESNAISCSMYTTWYANHIVAYSVPTSLPSGYTAPCNFAGYPTTSRTPYIEILTGSNFGTFLGLSVGNYGKDQAANYSVNSNITPVGSTVNSLVIRCSLVNNNISSATDVIDSFPINGTFGSNLNYLNNIEKWIKLSPGRYNNFIVTIQDQNLNDINILDNNILMNFIIRFKK